MGLVITAGADGGEGPFRFKLWLRRHCCKLLQSVPTLRTPLTTLGDRRLQHLLISSLDLVFTHLDIAFARRGAI